MRACSIVMGVVADVVELEHAGINCCASACRFRWCCRKNPETCNRPFQPDLPHRSRGVMALLPISKSSNAPVLLLRISMSVSLARPEKSPKPAIDHSNPTWPIGPAEVMVLLRIS